MIFFKIVAFELVLTRIKCLYRKARSLSMGSWESLILRFSLHKKRYRHLLTWDQAPQQRGEKGGRQKRKISERSELGLGGGDEKRAPLKTPAWQAKKKNQRAKRVRVRGGDEKRAPLKTPAWEATRLNSQRTSNQKT